METLLYLLINFFPYISVSADMEEFIKEYISEANEEIEQFNRQLELQEEPDLFGP